MTISMCLLFISVCIDRLGSGWPEPRFKLVANLLFSGVARRSDEYMMQEIEL